jgi:hypothetical protein
MYSFYFTYILNMKCLSFIDDIYNYILNIFHSKKESNYEELKILLNTNEDISDNYENHKYYYLE